MEESNDIINAVKRNGLGTPIRRRRRNFALRP